MAKSRKRLVQLVKTDWPSEVHSDWVAILESWCHELQEPTSVFRDVPGALRYWGSASSGAEPGNCACHGPTSDSAESAKAFCFSVTYRKVAMRCFFLFKSCFCLASQWNETKTLRLTLAAVKCRVENSGSINCCLSVATGYNSIGLITSRRAREIWI